ncbi:MAG: hypothetical protein V1875_04900 [Candidatus Altiarchaeota archaeon]
MKKRSRGLAGLDALILFIALLLVAAVTGMVLMSAHANLINRGQTIQKEKVKEIQKPIIVESLRGVDTDDDGSLNQLVFAAHLRDGDEPINFNSTIIIVNTKALNCTTLQYGPDADENCSYTLSYAKRSRDFEYDYLNRGDFIEVSYSGPNVIARVEDTRARFTFVPSHGSTTDIKASIPERITPNNMQIWPLNG